MAWNEPGSGNQDPWGNRGDRGPPDLDEAFRKLQAQLAGIFGFGKRGGGKSGRGGFSSGLFGAFIAVLAAAYGFWGLYQVDQGERGVVFRFGAVQSAIVMPGLHWNPPIIDRGGKGQRHPGALQEPSGAHAHRGREHRRCEHDRAVCG